MDSINVVIKEKDKLGLVGRNGAGKSTLLKILAGEQTPDSGQISRPTGSTLGFLHQEMHLPRGKSVIEETLTAFDELKRLETRIEEINKEFAVREDYQSDSYARLIEELTAANERFAILGGSSMEADAEKILQGLGFKNTDMNRMVEEFSGGWQMRIELAKMLLAKPDYLLLDEPTNHLDIESILWLESFLKDYPGAVVLISHDRMFLDNVTLRTVEIELGKVYEYKASYSKYLELRKDRREKTEAAFKNQQAKIAQTEKLIEKFRAKANKAKMAQSLIKQLDKMDRIELESEDTATMRIKFPPAPRSGDVALEVKKLSKSYGDLQVLNKVSFKMDRGDRVAFVGQNGQGKTTLAKIIVKEIMPSGGDLKIGHNIHIGYYAQNQSDSLQPDLTLLETMENAAPPELRTKVRNILGAFRFSGEDVEKKVMVLSGGERARLALACLLLRPINLLVLDEPTNHLDILSKEVLKQAVQDFDGTLIVVSHDRDFLSGLTNLTLEFRDKKLHQYLGDVNFFLEKRRLDNMRAVEMSTKGTTQNQEPEKENGEIDRKVLQKLERAVQNQERKIEDLEKDLKALEGQMAVEGFYQSDTADVVLQNYQQIKKDLEAAFQAWEEATEELDAYAV
jgi:ATP-binding cassette subfamily F protein 3